MQTSSSVDYGYLRQLVFGLSQNVLDPSRDYLFETRLTKLLRNQGMTHLEELVQHLKLRRDPVLERSIAEAMTINETSFFRDSRPFELLRMELLPKLIEARRNVRGLRFLSAACSTGQEAYSLGMMMRSISRCWQAGTCALREPTFARRWWSGPRRVAITASRSIAGCRRDLWCATSTTRARTGR